MTGIDTAIVLVYLAGVLVVGTYFGKYVHSQGDFFLASRALPFWAIGMSIVVSDIGAMDFIAAVGNGYRYGIAQANFDWIGSMPAMVFAALVFVPYYWRAGVYTVPEFLGRRYNRTVWFLEAVIWGCFLLVMLALMLWVTAGMLKNVLQWNVYTAVWITAIGVGIYTVSGGLAAVVMTDVIQLVVMFVGGGALVFLSMWKCGFVSGLGERFAAMGPEYEQHLELLLPHDTATPFPWTGIVFGLGIVLAGAYFVGNQAVVQRVLGARSEWDAKAGMLFGGFLKLFIPLFIVLPGLTGLALYPELSNPDDAVPTMIAKLLPPGLRGLMFAAFLAALMSSVDSYLNSTATIWMQDVITPLLRLVRAELSIRSSLVVGRILTGVFIIVAAVTAPYVASERLGIYNFIQTLLSLFQGPTLALLLLGIMWRRTTGTAAVAGLVTGVVFCVALNFADGVFPSEDPFLFVALWSFLLTLGITVAVSLVTAPEPEEKIAGLTWGSVVSRSAVQEGLRRRAES